MHNYKEIKMLLLTNLNKSIDKRMGGGILISERDLSV